MELPDSETLMELLEDEHLRGILRTSARECVSWEEFLNMRLPAGASAATMWELLGALRRSGAVYFPIPDVLDYDYWYTRTFEISSALSTITCNCGKGSRLHRAISDASGRRFLVRSKIEESVAATQLDGLAMGPEQTRDLLRKERKPRNANERLVRNTAELVDRMVDYVDEPFSPELLSHLRDLTLEGVDVESLQMSERRGGFGQENFPEDLLAEMAPRQAQLICDYANETTGDSYDHPFVRAIIIRESVRGYRVAPPVSGSVARLAFALYAHKKDLPVLALLPMSKASLEWSNGELVLPRYKGRATFYTYPRHKEHDLTPFLTVSSGCAIMALNELREQMERSSQRDEQLRGMLQENVELNHRQRSILGRALRNPDAEFTIRYHKTNHNVAYATARADLVGLVEKGLLVQKKRGKAFIFVPHPDLKSRLGT